MTSPDFDYSSPVSFTFKQRLALTFVPPLGTALLKAFCVTCRWVTRNEAIVDRVQEQHGRVLVGFWHETLAIAAFHYRNTGYHTLTSYSFDGELAARLVKHCGMRALRGSSSRGGHKALKDLVKATQFVERVGFTLDGPKGPRRVAKPGIAILSIKTGIPVVPQAFVAKPAWRTHSWDRLAVPKPFGKIVSVFGEPITPPKRLSSENVEGVRLEVERQLNALHRELEAELAVDVGLASTE